MGTNIKTPKKLIEVALPLDDINDACVREKMAGGKPHPRGIHLWWARRPLAAARAVIFAQMVNDPGYQRELGYGVNKKEAEIKREKLFQIIRDLVKWESTNSVEVLNRARKEIWKSWRETCHLNRNHPQAAELFNPDRLPAFHDPFAGGGAIPLEAQRFGLESYASDLNPVAVMINKSMIEIPPKFSGQKPVGPIPEADKHDKKRSTKDAFDHWSGVRGLAEDVRRYGHWMREEAFRRIGHLYPKVRITSNMVANCPDLKAHEGEELTVIAWLWARTVKSPSPAFDHVDVPLVSNFVLSSKKGKEAYIQPVIEGDNYRFEVKTGSPPASAKDGTRAGKGGNFNCVMSGAPIPVKTIREQGQKGMMRQRLMAIVAQGKLRRVYLPPEQQHTLIANNAKPEWAPNVEMYEKALGFRVGNYGLKTWRELFTPRQLLALGTFSDLVQNAREQLIADAIASGMPDDGIGLGAGGVGATAYADAVAVYLTFCVDRCADFNNSLVCWVHITEAIGHLFTGQTIPMVRDFGEANIVENVRGGFVTCLEYQAQCLSQLQGDGVGYSTQQDAASQDISQNKIISTDPPYYNNIGYADLSDFFYVWMRRSLRSIYPDLFATMAVPKLEELVATPGRHGDSKNPETFFLDGMKRAIHKLAVHTHPVFPVTIYYAFKQSETKGGGTSSMGWETFLEAVIQAGFLIGGTWPIRSERMVRIRAIGSNALASSIVLVCCKRPTNADTISRQKFQRKLREEMPEALETMIGGKTGQTSVAPVDLAQAAIGPGMAIFSKYETVLNQDGSRMGVHSALTLINRAITDYLSPESGSFDADTQFCSSWFDQYGWSAGSFGKGDTLARAKGTSVGEVCDAGVAESGEGKVRLLKWNEYEVDWDPSKDSRIPVWEACHQMIRRLNFQGESAAGELLAKMPEKGESIRQLAYYLYTLCERKKLAEEARAYNELIGSWQAIATTSYDGSHVKPQNELDI